MPDPTVVLAQVNRPASKDSESLSPHDLPDSRARENDAAGVLVINKVYKPEGLAHSGRQAWNVELTVVKTALSEAHGA